MESSPQGDTGPGFGFAASHDVPVPYLQRIRSYYRALATRPRSWRAAWRMRWMRRS